MYLVIIFHHHFSRSALLKYKIKVQNYDKLQWNILVASQNEIVIKFQFFFLKYEDRRPQTPPSIRWVLTLDPSIKTNGFSSSRLWLSKPYKFFIFFFIFKHNKHMVVIGDGYVIEFDIQLYTSSSGGAKLDNKPKTTTKIIYYHHYIQSSKI